MRSNRAGQFPCCQRKHVVVGGKTATACYDEQRKDRENGGEIYLPDYPDTFTRVERLQS